MNLGSTNKLMHKLVKAFVFERPLCDFFNGVFQEKIGGEWGIKFLILRPLPEEFVLPEGFDFNCPEAAELLSQIAGLGSFDATISFQGEEVEVPIIVGKSAHFSEDLGQL